MQPPLTAITSGLAALRRYSQARHEMSVRAVGRGHFLLLPMPMTTSHLVHRIPGCCSSLTSGEGDAKRPSPSHFYPSPCGTFGPLCYGSGPRLLGGGGRCEPFSGRELAIPIIPSKHSYDFHSFGRPQPTVRTMIAVVGQMAVIINSVCLEIIP